MSIKLVKLSKAYGELVLFNDLSIKINSGEFITLIGRSGLGKSTLLNIIGSFEKPDNGSVFFEGEKVEKPDIKRIIIFQSFDQLLPWKTVRENIEFPLTHSKEEGLNIEDVLEKLDLKEIEKLYPYQLSGGMKQRVALGRAIITKPKVMLMDEPFGSLDIASRNYMQELIVDVWKEYNITIIFVTHDVSEAVKLGNRIMILADNKITEIVNPIQRPRNRSELNFQYFESEIIQYIK